MIIPSGKQEENRQDNVALTLSTSSSGEKRDVTGQSSQSAGGSLRLEEQLRAARAGGVQLRECMYVGVCVPACHQQVANIFYLISSKRI